MSYKGKFISAIIVAAGMGKRMASRISKQFIYLENKPILAYTLEQFSKSSLIDEMILVAKEDEIDYCKKEVVDKYKINKVTAIVSGGKERQDSVYNGLRKANQSCEVILIHDGVRPFVKEDHIIDTIKGACIHGACVVGVPVKDTIKIINEDNLITETPDRRKIWAVQTPQTFSYELIIKAYEHAKLKKLSATDDSSLVEALGYKVKMVLGSYNNIKITTPEDIRFAETILRELNDEKRR